MNTRDKRIQIQRAAVAPKPSYEELKRLREAASPDLNTYRRMSNGLTVADYNFIAYAANHALSLIQRLTEENGRLKVDMASQSSIVSDYFDRNQKLERDLERAKGALGHIREICYDERIPGTRQIVEIVDEALQ